ncbi:hypothetical protein CVS40_2322 [Lucilia cuprina]|nr:hypothetical protein CVS40_2322 [Lucilia cuprina]
MSETREQILEEIKLQGDLVRKLKAAKEPKEKAFETRQKRGKPRGRKPKAKKPPATVMYDPVPQTSLNPQTQLAPPTTQPPQLYNDYVKDIISNRYHINHNNIVWLRRYCRYYKGRVGFFNASSPCLPIRALAITPAHLVKTWIPRKKLRGFGPPVGAPGVGTAAAGWAAGCGILTMSGISGMPS